MAYPVSKADTEIIKGATFRSPQRPTHGGIDFTPRVRGTRLPVYAVGAGRIIIADKIAERGDSSGKDIALQLSGDGSIWWYGHLSEVHVNVGDWVADGKQLGLMGTTGSTSTGKATSTGVHLHLERHKPRLNDETDPWPFIKDEPDPSTYAINQKASSPVKEPEKAVTPAPTKPVSPNPIPEDDMTKTLKYRQVGRPEVLLINPATGMLWHIPSRAYLGYVDALGIADEAAERELPEDQMRVLIQITRQAHDSARHDAVVEMLSKDPHK